jgi:hypothetical protein
MASAQKIVAFNDECEGVRYSDWICDLDTCPGRRHVADHASEATPIVEDDVSRLQGATSLAFSAFYRDHEAKAPGCSSGSLHIPEVH